jgi:hypothetical protein
MTTNDTDTPAYRAAVIDLTDQWGNDTCYDTGRHLTHNEAVTLAAVFVGAGHADKADLILIGSLDADVDDNELTPDEADQQLLELRSEAGVVGDPGLEHLDLPWH